MGGLNPGEMQSKVAMACSERQDYSRSGNLEARLLRQGNAEHVVQGNLPSSSVFARRSRSASLVRRSTLNSLASLDTEGTMTLRDR